MRRMLIGLAFLCTTHDLWTKPVPQADQKRPGLLIVSKRTGNAELFLIDDKGQGARNLTNSSAENSYPAWSPDGKSILFASLRDGDGFRIYRMDADGGNVKQLTNNASAFGSVYPSYSPDGKKIMWSDGDQNGIELHVADADGGNIQKLTNNG